MLLHNFNNYNFSDPYRAKVRNLNGLTVTVIRVFQGGETGIQELPFNGAFYDANFPRDRVHIEYLTVKAIKDRRMTPDSFVDWLLDSDIHFCLSHIHQGIKQLRWHMNDIHNSLQRLKTHKGFPCGDQVDCCVFLQDKYRYLDVLHNTRFIRLNNEGDGMTEQHHMTNPTLSIPLLEYGYISSLTKRQIERSV